MAVAMLRRLTSIGSDRLSGTLLFLLALFILWQNRAYPIGTLTEPGAGFVTGAAMRARAFSFIRMSAWM
jgi:hypothetical protein